MILYPAIDLMDGRCVRLLRGDFGAATLYADDPPAVARELVSAGARALHVVDLDGVRAGRPVQVETVGEIVRAGAVPVQAGGGLRTLEDVERLFGAGVSRALLGTAALRDPEWAAAAVRRFGADRVVVAVDVSDGVVRVAGWTEGLDVALPAVLDRLGEAGVLELLVTAVGRDGTLEGPDLDLYRDLLERPLRVVAAGGIASDADLHRLARLGIAGAVVGRALYEGLLPAAEIGRLSRELSRVGAGGNSCS